MAFQLRREFRNSCHQISLTCAQEVWQGSVQALSCFAVQSAGLAALLAESYSGPCCWYA